MMNKLAKEIIKNYKCTVNKLYTAKLISAHHELSYKVRNQECILEYDTKSSYSNILYDSSLNAIDLYNELLIHDQFNIEFIDGSILIFQCLLNKEQIKKQRIIYIKPFLNMYNECSENFDSWEAYQIAEETSNLLNFPLILRVDYDCKETKADHPYSHLTISNIENCRIPIVSNISFERFVEFILHQIFNIYNIDINKANYPKTIRDNETKMIHIGWD